MAIKSFKPNTPSLRYMTVSTFEGISKKKPEKSLTEHQTSTGGRNNAGRITSRFRGGGHKQRRLCRHRWPSTPASHRRRGEEALPDHRLEA